MAGWLRCVRWAQGAAALALVVAVAGCGDDGGTATTTPSTSPIGTASTTSAAAPTSAPGTADPPPSTPRRAAVPPTVPAGTIVVLDPGHNGANGANPSSINRLVDAGGFQKACNTTGTAEGGLTESRYNWDLAQLVRNRLVLAGAQVLLTRQDDDGWGPCIDERGQLAATAGAAALVSLHADGAAASANGFHVIHPTSIPGYTEAIAAPATLLATVLRDALVETDFTPSTYVGGDGVVARGDLGTLNRAEVPAVMVEVGNMHNADDLAMMTSPAERERLADALATGIVRFVVAHPAPANAAGAAQADDQESATPSP